MIINRRNSDLMKQNSNQQGLYSNEIIYNNNNNNQNKNKIVDKPSFLVLFY